MPAEVDVASDRHTRRDGAAERLDGAHVPPDYRVLTPICRIGRRHVVFAGRLVRGILPTIGLAQAAQEAKAFQGVEVSVDGFRTVALALVWAVLMGAVPAAAKDQVINKGAFADLPKVSKQKLNKVKIGLPDGWYEAKLPDNAKEAMIQLYVKNDDINAHLFVYKFPTFQSFEDHSQFLAQVVDEAMPGHETMFGPYALKKGMMAKRAVGYRGAQIHEGRELVVQMFTAYRVSQGLSNFGVHMIGVTNVEVQALLDVIGENMNLQLDDQTFRQHFLAIVQSM